MRAQTALILTLLAALGAATAVAERPAAARPVYRSPFDPAFSPGGNLLAVSDRTAGVLAVIDLGEHNVLAEVALNGEPMGVAWHRAGSVLVAEYGAGTVAEVDVLAGKVVRRLAVGPKSVGIAVAAEKQIVAVTDAGLNVLLLLDLTDGQLRKRIELMRMPYFVSVTPDGSTALVGHLLPVGPAGDFDAAAAVSIVDLEALEKAADVPLPGGSTAVRELAVSPDGKWAYAAHTLGHVAQSTVQLGQGWVNTNAVSIIDLGGKKLHATALLDRPGQGAADPWGLALSPDGDTLWVTLAGVHQLARVDLGRLHTLLAGRADESLLRRARTAEPPSIMHVWDAIREHPAYRDFLAYDIAALSTAGLLKRTDLPGAGPRGLAISPDGKRLAAAAYYGGEVVLIDTRTGAASSKIPLGRQPEPDLARRGEILFHDARLAEEGWLSCATCHPDGHADGLNWDLPNDGFGNPKNTKSLMLSDQTPPAMATAVRPDYHVATEAGFRRLLFHEPEPRELRAVEAYIRSLQAERSPYLAAGRLSPAAERGKDLFQSPRTGCARCHPAPLFTDRMTHDVGTRYDLDQTTKFDTPTLIGLWRTGPYLHHGNAVTLRQVLTEFNRQDRHGRTSDLSAEELDALAAYLLSL